MDDLIIPLFIKTRSTISSESMISAFGGKVETVAGDIITAEVPLSSVRDLAQSSDIIYIEASTISEMKIDVSRVEAKVNQLHNGTGISRHIKAMVLLSV